MDIRETLDSFDKREKEIEDRIAAHKSERFIIQGLKQALRKDRAAFYASLQAPEAKASTNPEEQTR